jgi:hypothetical protein
VSGEQPAARSPFGYASDYYADDERTTQEPTIPLMTPFQRFLLDGLEKLWQEQGKSTARLANIESHLSVMAPRLEQLEQQAQWWKKAVAVAKYAAPAIVLQLAPSLAKYVQVIVDAVGRVQ